MTIQSQLDQVLALFDLPDTPLNGVLVAEHCYAFMKEHGPAIRAAVGCGKPYAWEHGLAVEGQRMPQLSYDKKQPFGKRGVDHGGTVDSLPLYTSQPVAVGGEAVAWVVKNDPIGYDNAAHALDYICSEVDSLPIGTKLYASPTATVDVGALRRALAEYPDKNPQQLQARKVCAGVLALAASYEENSNDL